VRAVVFDEVGGPLRVREVPDPVCPPDGVVVRVGATGVCRSDWHAWRGHEVVALPHVPGHELAGVVVEVGPLVTSWAVGQRVTAPFVCGCGRCPWCDAGEPQVCPDQTQPGFTGWGSFAELVALHAADLNLVALPDGLDDVAAASLGCRFATAYRAVVHHGRLERGQALVVLGCGGVGLSAVAVGAALDARVVAVDVSTEALERAREVGATDVLQVGRDWSAEQIASAVVDLTDGAHVSVEALGSAVLARASVLSLRRRGRHVQVGLLHGAEAAPPLPFDRVIGWELELYGAHGMAAADYPAMLDLVVSGRVRPEQLVGRVVGLDEAGAALAAADRPGPGMTVVRVSGT
jgi:D-arabinose 1-dehydrogenase-like Zn-dependent alcohol dehydrogenase